jgi:serine/threonine protein kinase
MSAKVLDGRYKLIKKLGAGGFGHTYMARDMRRPGSPLCVVKHLKPASTDAEFIREARRLFNTEAEVLEKLGRHDQIPQLLAYFEENQQFFLVQEYIEGTPLNQEWKAEPAPDQPLSEPLPQKKITEAEAIALLKDVLGILEFVHAEGVVHRDIKPDI